MMNDRRMIQKLKRYSRGLDDLLRIEIESLFNSSVPEKRIEITEMFNTQKELFMPDEWMELTLKKGNENEIMALAKYCRYPGTKTSCGMSLSEILLGKNGLIKCALYENPEFLSDFEFIAERNYSYSLFLKSNFIERLALIRNSNIGFKVLKSIYDVNDSIFNLSDDQRGELISAFSTNEGHRDKVLQIQKDYSDFWDLSLKVLAHSNKDITHRIVYSIYRYLPCKDNKIVEIYRQLKDSSAKDEPRAELYESARKYIFNMIESLPLEKQKRKTLIPLYKEALNDPNEEIKSKAAFLMPESETEDNFFYKFKNVFKGTAKSLNIIWFFTQILIKFIVMYAIYSSLSSKFETIAISLILIIYFQIIFIGMGWGMLGTEGVKEGIKLFNHIRTLLQDTIQEEEKKAQESLIDKMKLGWKFYVRYAFDFIFYGIAIFNLLRVTLFNSN